MPDSEPLVRTDGLEVSFPLSRSVADVARGRAATRVHAVDGVSLEVRPGETLGLVGESGCGKTTLGRALLGLVRPTAGGVRYRGGPTEGLSGAALLAFRRSAQMVFQDPFSSLNPRMRVGSALAEVFRVHGLCPPKEERGRVADLMRRVGLRPEDAEKRPAQFSGGERQRVVIARALALRPEFLVADEPVSSLDVSVQAQVLNLLRELKAEMSLTMLFISHDLAVVRYVADRVAVMYLGRIVEEGARGAIFSAPRHPYTVALLRSVPGLGRSHMEAAVEGEPPSAIHVPKGCRFASRCPFAVDRCRAEYPTLRVLGESGHRVACHLAEELPAHAV